MIDNLDGYVNTLEKYKFTQEQYLTLLLIYKKRTDLIIKYKNIYDIQGSIISKHFIEDLIKKGFLIKKGTTYEITKKFYEIFVDRNTATDEIYDIYPSYVIIDGVNRPLGLFDRNAFSILYDNAINSNMEEHIEILKDIQYGKENDLLNLSLEKFIKAQYWKILRKKRLMIEEVVEYEHSF